MGNRVSSNLSRVNLPIKRKALTWEDSSEAEFSIDADFQTPKRRKLTTTSKYIYKTLFEEGQGSDVKLKAFNKTWHLHKLYICQSPYFNSMFNGSWLETQSNEICIGIEDDNITPDALHKVFGAFYQDEIHIGPLEAVSILASATLLQLDDLIVQCQDVMNESINIETVVNYYEASELYGLSHIRESCLDWLYKNLSTKMAESPKYLRTISCELMTDLITSHLLVVVQTEFSLYLMLKQWLFLKDNPLWEGDFKSCSSSSHLYFENIINNETYLETNNGKSYQSPFRALRLKHLIVHHLDIESIESDRIIPVEWFMPIFKVQWYQMLRVEQGLDKGPKLVTEEDFNKQCIRYGRVLERDEQHSWRWTGFNFGFDLVVYYLNGSFKLCRFLKADTNNRSISSYGSSMSIITHRRLMYRLGVYSLDKNGNVIQKSETKIHTVSLTENEQIMALKLNQETQFPLLLSANFLLTTPLPTFDEKMPSTLKESEQYA